MTLQDLIDRWRERAENWGQGTNEADLLRDCALELEDWLQQHPGEVINEQRRTERPGETD
jgi:hypothetical protein